MLTRLPFFLEHMHELLLIDPVHLQWQTVACIYLDFTFLASLWLKSVYVFRCLM